MPNAALQLDSLFNNRYDDNLAYIDRVTSAPLTASREFPATIILCFFGPKVYLGTVVKNNRSSHGVTKIKRREIASL